MVMPHDHKMEGRGGSRSDLPRQEPLRACREASLAYGSNRISPWVRVGGWGGGILLSISVGCTESQQGVVPPGRRAGSRQGCQLHPPSLCQSVPGAQPGPACVLGPDHEVGWARSIRHLSSCAHLDPCKPAFMGVLGRRTPAGLKSCPFCSVAGGAQGCIFCELSSSVRCSQ